MTAINRLAYLALDSIRKIRKGYEVTDLTEPGTAFKPSLILPPAKFEWLSGSLPSKEREWAMASTLRREFISSKMGFAESCHLSVGLWPELKGAFPAEDGFLLTPVQRPSCGSKDAFSALCWGFVRVYVKIRCRLSGAFEL
ncbi:hypothetical protein RIF29_45472 [Crotalaria pallida]|uniref:Uncharacterized protein n=1 Tax=Crotalaria pallida TaxID=3830 RepID=A0AAN9HL82_CROPI